MVNTEKILAIEILCSCQGIDFLKPLKCGKGTAVAYDSLRRTVKHIDEDVMMNNTIESVCDVIYRDGFVDKCRKIIRKSYLKKPGAKKKRLDLRKIYSEIKYYAIGYYNKFDEDHVWIMSASIAFNIIICIIPITLILFSILGIYLQRDGAQAYLNESLNKVVGITPELKEKISNLILGAIDELSSNSLLTAIIGSIGILWTSSGLFSTLRDVLNRIYKTRSDTFYLWVKLRDIGMVFLILTVFLLSFSSTFILSIFKAIDRRCSEIQF